MQKFDGFIKRWIRMVLIWLVGVAARRLNDPYLMAWVGPVGEFKETRYRKLPDGLSDHLAGLIAADKRWNGTTAYVFMRLVRRIDLRRNRAELSRGDLEKLTGMNVKTVERHVRLLEKAGVIAVERRRQTRMRNMPNLYRLCGEYAGVILYGEPDVQEADPTPGPSPKYQEGEKRADEEDSISARQKIEGQDSPTRENKWTGLGRKYLHTLKQHAAKEQHATHAAAHPDFISGESAEEKLPEAPDGFQDDGHGEPLPDVPGMMPVMVQRLCDTYGHRRVRDAVKLAKDRKRIKSLPAFVTAALKEGYMPPPPTPSPQDTDGQHYISGPFADFTNGDNFEGGVRSELTKRMLEWPRFRLLSMGYEHEEIDAALKHFGMLPEQAVHGD